MEEQCFLAHSHAYAQRAFLDIPAPPAQGMVPPIAGCVLLHQLLIRMVPPQTTSQGNLSEAILQSRLSCRVALGCVRLTVLVTVTVSKVHGRL